jgi:hypothetical protein
LNARYVTELARTQTISLLTAGIAMDAEPLRTAFIVSDLGLCLKNGRLKMVVSANVRNVNDQRVFALVIMNRFPKRAHKPANGVAASVGFE